ncbi:hypothetical protein ElyMa_003145000 [Elysia marginata]|uniref:Uncharacterized protein n=1 Tax=Elysia marginata TaxID=1093978 RepID=A0AAV4IU93_9GAST|nr:hypothetical protein ElyMa_003145000 [Elysia marginata]
MNSLPFRPLQKFKGHTCFQEQKFFILWRRHDREKRQHACQPAAEKFLLSAFTVWGLGEKAQAVSLQLLAAYEQSPFLTSFCGYPKIARQNDPEPAYLQN